jgi:hypothetical protein
MEPNGFVDNMLYGPPPGGADRAIYHSIGLFDIVVILAILFFYIMLPLRAIDRTCNLMYAYPAYGEDPVAWRAKIIKKYWQVPAKILVGLALVAFYIIMAPSLKTFIPDDLKLFIYFLIAPYLYISVLLLFFWPLKIWREAKVEEVTIQYCREQDIEDRIAAGLATKSDMAYYLKSSREKAYWRGYWDGRR